MVTVTKCSFYLKMTRARFLTILYFFIHCQGSRGQQHVSANALNPQQVIQSNNGYNVQHTQNPDSTRSTTQMQQNLKQAPVQQQTIQQFANIPMQTFNTQPCNSANFQPANQAVNFQQVPQHFNVKQDIAQQSLSHNVNSQQATILPINSQQTSNGNTVSHSAGLHQTLPAQSVNTQPHAYPVNLQQPPTQQTISFQQQSAPQPVQQPIVVQTGNLQQQTIPQVNTMQQTSTNIQYQPTPQLVNIQQSPPQSVLSQQSSIIQPLAYQPQLDKYDLAGTPLQQGQNIPQLSLVQSHNSQQLPPDQIDLQSHIPYNLGGYQVVSYQKPCHQSDIVSTLPVALQLSTNSNPTLLAAVPTAISNNHVTDQMYIVSPQNYLSPTSYSPIVVTDNHAVVPVMAVSNTIPASLPNFVTNKQLPCADITENWKSSLKTPDIGMLLGLQEQFPLVSLLHQPTSSLQSALLSSIFSSMQSPSPSSPYIIPSGYSTPTMFSPPCNSQSSKLSLKSLLPLLLDLLQDKYTNNGCQCGCCNCANNHCNMHQQQTNTQIVKEIEEKAEENCIENDKTTESEDVKPQLPKKANNSENEISDNSTEIEDIENSGCEDEEEDDDVTEDSAEEDNVDE